MAPRREQTCGTPLQVHYFKGFSKIEPEEREPFVVHRQREGNSPSLIVLALLLQALGRHEAHVGALDGLADGGGVGRVVLAGLA